MNIPNKTGELPVVPNLDDIINQITQNGDFKKMMDNITENINENGDNVDIEDDGEKSKSENNTKSENNIVNSNKKSESDEKLYDTFCTFFSDNEGNSLADILTDINKNLSNLVRVLDDKNKE